MNNAPVVLLILDGWGLGPGGVGNAITQSHLTNIPQLWNSYPHTTLSASGRSVGLPEKSPGNTETGHINIGAGRIVYQDLLRIDSTIENRSFFKNDAFIGAIRHANEHHSNIHVMGLFSDANVHASKKHLCALMEIFKEQQTGPIYLHLFTDGRDSPPQSALNFFKEAHSLCESFTFAKIATIIGRYYAMDRDRRWDRTELAYKALTEGSQYTASSAVEAIEYAYKRSETDEFIKPTVIFDANKNPYPRIDDNDAIIFYNYRIDRPRQLTRAFVLPDFEQHVSDFSFDPYAVKYYKKHIITPSSTIPPFRRTKVLKNLFFVTMTEYERDVPCVVAFPPQLINDSLGEVVASNEIRQLRMSESEKERFVTYYFNGMREERFAGEDRLIIPSPKVATYDLLPQMAAEEITNRLLDRLSLRVYGLIVVNYANPDMVGHTGNIGAAIKACECVDVCVGRIVTSVLSKNGTCIITADHGNVEEMLTQTGGISTEHTVFPVPLIIVNRRYTGKYTLLESGKLGDIAPTILTLLGISIPEDMTGTNLLKDIL
jgi:2,3-bisphosphoglycerate-independent phosphoglycerate mutase